MQQRKIEMIFQNALDRPGSRLLLRRQAGVEIRAMPVFEVAANEGGIGDHRAVVVDEWNLALGRLRRRAAFAAVGEAGHLELDLGLHDEGAGIGQSEGRSKAEKRDHGGRSLRFAGFS